MAQTTNIKQFESVFPKLKEVLLEHAKSYNLPQQALDWYKQVSAGPVAASASLRRTGPELS